MFRILARLIDRLESSMIAEANVIPWACPILSFGDLSTSRVATLGLNPSNREFMDQSGRELQGRFRRFETLSSLGLTSWSEVDARHLDLILSSYRVYFRGTPHDSWFKRLDRVIAGVEVSYYDTPRGAGQLGLIPYASGSACHLDLIPYATTCKWNELTAQQRSTLLAAAGDALGLLLRDSPVRILILNGRSVVGHFEELAGVSLEREEVKTWTLPRKSGSDVLGLAYRGVVGSLSGIQLEREVLILGFNHNLQSSFGVTADVLRAIRRWIARAASEAIH
jgi:hypothetical protein